MGGVLWHFWSGYSEFVSGSFVELDNGFEEGGGEDGDDLRKTPVVFYSQGSLRYVVF